MICLPQCTRMLPPDIYRQVTDLSFFLTRSVLHKLYIMVTLNAPIVPLYSVQIYSLIFIGNIDFPTNEMVAFSTLDTTMPQNSPIQMHGVYRSITLPINVFTKWDNPMWYIWYRYVSIECMLDRKMHGDPTSKRGMTKSLKFRKIHQLGHHRLWIVFEFLIVSLRSFATVGWVKY